MENRFRIIYYVPNLFHKSRHAIGVLLNDEEGLRYVSAERFPCACCFDYGSDQVGRVEILLGRLINNMPRSIQEQQIRFTKFLELGEIMYYSVMEDNPEKWIRRYVLPR